MSKKKIFIIVTILFALFAFTFLVWQYLSTPIPLPDSPISQTQTQTPDEPSIAIKMDLPIYLDGIPSLIHPIVVSATSQYASKSYADEKISSHINMGNYNFSGDMFNLVFEDITTNEHKSLFTKNNQKIQRVDYPTHPIKPISNPNQPLSANELKLYRHFIYEVKENISPNREANSIQNQTSLYISDEKGNGLKKLHPDNQYFIESRWVSHVERYYFTTKTDSNHDGKITLQDNSFTYYIDFKTENPIVRQYDFMPK